MKIRFWIFLALVVAGAVVLGYWSGQYHGLQRAQLSAHAFLRDFTRSTDLERYLQQRGEQEWLERLNTYGLVGPDSYLRFRQQWTGIMLVGLLFVTSGLVGLRFTLTDRDR